MDMAAHVCMQVEVGSEGDHMHELYVVLDGKSDSV